MTTATRTEKTLDLDKRIKVRVVIEERETNETLLVLIQFALENSQSAHMGDLLLKKKLLKKLEGENVSLTSEETVMIKNACLQTLKDGATLAVIEAIAPSDLQ